MINWLCVCSISNAKLQREGERASEFEGEQNIIENGAREREREGKGREEKTAYCWQRGQKERDEPQMLDVSVRGTDKTVHKFENRMPTSWGLGGEVLAVGQEGKEVEAAGGGAGGC